MAWEIRRNAVWRCGGVFLRCDRCSRRCTRLYLPRVDPDLARRTCWGLTHESRSRRNYKDTLYGRGRIRPDVGRDASRSRIPGAARTTGRPARALASANAPSGASTSRVPVSVGRPTRKMPLTRSHACRERPSLRSTAPLQFARLLRNVALRSGTRGRRLESFRARRFTASHSVPLVCKTARAIVPESTVAPVLEIVWKFMVSPAMSTSMNERS